MIGRACCTGSSDLSRMGALVFGGSFGRAISNTLSSRLSILIFTGVITFFSSVSRAFAAKPLCNRFKVFSSIILVLSSSSSCCCCCCCCLPGCSSSANSASSSLDDLRLTLGAIAICCVLLLRDVERDFLLLFVFLF